jgi:hypothetical protein
MIALTNQVLRVPNSTSTTSNASLSIPIGIERADETFGTVPVSSSADTIIQLIIPESTGAWASFAVATVPVGIGGA